MAIIRVFLETFVFNTSMRGFMKLYKTPHRLLRFLWAVYVLSMLSLWITACYYLIEHYAGFYVTMQQSEKIQDITPLPSITLCSQAPMGDHAKDLWDNGTIMSPSDLHRDMQRSMLKAFGRDSTRDVRAMYAAKDLFYADKISTYFQNLNIDEARRIGIQSDDLILFCLMKHTPNKNPSVSHDEVCSVAVHWVRHPLYLNCYTATVDPKETHDVSSISLILRAGMDHPEPSQGHIFDLFTQSDGLKVTLHEPGTYPNIDEDGISVGLGRNTEIHYSLVKHRRLNIGNERSKCLDSYKVEQKSTLRDFDETYNYTFEACMSQEIGRLILKECKCVSAFHLVGTRPNKDTPFCHYHQGDDTVSMLARLDCVRNIKLPHKIAVLRSTTCHHRCNFNRFEMQVSSSEWLPSKWQLVYILRLARAWDTIIEGRESNEAVSEAKKLLFKFMTADSLDDIVNATQLDVSRLTLVTVSRATYNTIVKTETLQVTLSTLLAQIGGLGSVTIGLTITVLFEICEYSYLIVFQLHKRAVDKKRRGDEEADDDKASPDDDGVQGSPADGKNHHHAAEEAIPLNSMNAASDHGTTADSSSSPSIDIEIEEPRPPFVTA